MMTDGPEEIRKRLKINNLMTVALAMTAFIYSFIFVYYYHTPVLAFFTTSGGCFALICLFISKYWKNETFVLNYLCLAFFTVVFGISLYSGGIASPIIAWLPPIPLLSIFLNRGKCGICWAVICIASVAFLFVMNHLGIQIIENPANLNRFDIQLIDTIFIIFIITFLGLLQERETKNVMLAKERIQKMQITDSIQSSLGLMSGSLAHEINNPLMTILGNIEIIKKNTGPISSDFEKQLSNMYDASFHIKKIIQTMKLITNNQIEENTSEINVQVLIQQISLLFKEKFKSHGINFQIDIIDSCSPILKTQKGQLAAIIFEIMDNALDAVKDIPTKWITFQISVQEKKMYLKCIDSGEASKVEFNTILQPFYSSKDLSTTTGLGLNKIYSSVQSLHGAFYFENHEDHTCFTIELPLS